MHPLPMRSKPGGTEYLEKAIYLHSHSAQWQLLGWCNCAGSMRPGGCRLIRKKCAHTHTHKQTNLYKQNMNCILGLYNFAIFLNWECDFKCVEPTWHSGEKYVYCAHKLTACSQDLLIHWHVLQICFLSCAHNIICNKLVQCGTIYWNKRTN